MSCQLYSCPNKLERVPRVRQDLYEAGVLDDLLRARMALGGYPLDSASPYRLWCLTYGPDHRLVGFRCRIDGLLHEPEEELAAALGLPTVEAKGEFIQIVR